MTRIISFFVVFSLLFSSTSYASFGKAKAKNQDKTSRTVSYYEPNADGLRKYLETLRYSEPQVYSQLNKTVNKYENRENIAFAVDVTSAVVGITLIVGSFTFLGKKDPDFPDSPKTNFPVLLGGMGVWLAGGVASGYIRPDREDFYDFINEHNRLKPNDPLEFSQYLPAPSYEMPNRVKQEVAQLSLDFKF